MSKADNLTRRNRAKCLDFYRRRRVVKVTTIERHDRTIYQRRPAFIRTLDTLAEISDTLTSIAESEYIDDITNELDALAAKLDQIRRRRRGGVQ